MGRHTTHRVALALLAVVCTGLVAFWALPVVELTPPVSQVLLDRDGRLLGATIAADEQWRFPPRDDLPERYRLALLTFEDRRFAQHPGVDPLALGRAIVTSLRAGHVVSGASTLTMQTVRIGRGNPPRTVTEKVVEMALALRLERAHTKAEILSMYASNAPFGGNTVGVDAAAWRYFGRPAAELSWAEAATLAVLPNAPALIHPGRNRDALRAKRDRLLDRLAAAGHIDADDLPLAKLESLPDAPRPVPRLAPHLLHRTRGRTTSTLSATLQQQATDVVWRHHRRLAPSRIHNLAALVVDVPTGEVLAYVGNVPDLDDAPHGNHVDVVRAPRSTGSTLKPLLYASMLEDGDLLPRELVPDVPLHLGGFSPQNFDRRYEGAVPADEALARSRNVPATWLLQRYGVDHFYGRLEGLGLDTLHASAGHYGLSLILGGAEGTLWNLTDLYRRMAWQADDPSGPPGRIHWHGDAVPDGHEALSPEASYLTAEALLRVARPGVHGAWEQFGSAHKVAWKTGTSWGFRDGWAIGFTPTVAIGVWVGNADGEGRPELTGVGAAAPVLFELFDLVDHGPWFLPPNGLQAAAVCSQSGQLAGPDCAHTTQQLLAPRGHDSPPCGHCQRVHLTADRAHRAHAGCRALDALHAESWFSLPADQESFYAPRHPRYDPLPPWAPTCAPPGGPTEGLSLLSPKPRTQVVVPVELDGQRGRLVMEAAHRDADATVHWHLDGRYLGSTTGRHQLEAAPGEGPHELVVVDDDGQQITRAFEVLLGVRQARRE